MILKAVIAVLAVVNLFIVYQVLTTETAKPLPPWDDVKSNCPAWPKNPDC